MDNPNELTQFFSEKSVIGGAIVGIFVAIYRLWRILKRDSKEDNLDSVEKDIREELREEIKSLKDQNKVLYSDYHKLLDDFYILKIKISHYEKMFELCSQSDTVKCPLKTIQFENIKLRNLGTDNPV